MLVVNAGEQDSCGGSLAFQLAGCSLERLGDSIGFINIFAVANGHFEHQTSSHRSPFWRLMS